MSAEGKGKLLRIYLNENARFEDKPLYEAITQKVLGMGVPGSMVFRGFEGAGFCCSSCRTHGLGMTISKCQPMVIEFIATEEKLNAVVPIVKQMLKSGVMIMQDADIVFNQYA